jgi:quercetin dioxygenase-like cupin family protein
VPHVRPSVRGTKTMGAALRPLLRERPENSRVPHISLVFREMWDTTELNPQALAHYRRFRFRFVVSHISGMWGTRNLFGIENEESMKILTAELHTSRKGPEAYFTGTVWLNEIVGATPPSHLKAIRVWFAPGSRTAWHTHPVGQTLHVLDGLGLVQLAGKAPQIIRPGDTVSIAPQERHWHGAAPGRTMTHLAIQETDEHGSDVVWLEHVSDDEYSQPPI